VDAGEIQRKGMDALAQLQVLQERVVELGNVASNLSTAEQVLSPEHAWVPSVKKSREEVLGQIENREDRAKSGFRQQILAKLTALIRKPARFSMICARRSAGCMRPPT
jgi:hypothetical protein